MINIKLNGKDKQIREGITIQGLLEEMDFQSKMFVVEKNLEILPKEHYDSYIIAKGDCIEIVGFFGGG